MNLIEVTHLMEWITEHRIDVYVKIDPLRDAILDLLVTEEIIPNIEDLPAPILN